MRKALSMTCCAPMVGKNLVVGIGVDAVFTGQLLGDGDAEITIALDAGIVRIGFDRVTCRLTDEVGREHVADGASREADNTAQLFAKVAQVTGGDDRIGGVSGGEGRLHRVR